MEKQAAQKASPDTRPRAHSGVEEDSPFADVNRVILGVTGMTGLVVMQIAAQDTVGKVEYNVSASPFNVVLPLFNREIPVF